LPQVNTDCCWPRVFTSLGYVGLAFDLSVWHLLFSGVSLIRFHYVSLMSIILYQKLDVKLILTTDFTDPFDKLRTSLRRLTQILEINLATKTRRHEENHRFHRIRHGFTLLLVLTFATENTEKTGVSGSIVYLATAACKTGFCRGALPSSTGPRILARLNTLPETTAGSGKREAGSGTRRGKGRNSHYEAVILCGMGLTRKGGCGKVSFYVFVC